MKLSPKVLFVLVLIPFVGIGARAQDMRRGQLKADIAGHAPAFSSVPVASEPSALGIRPTITHYATESDGDHSLEEATVVEQAFARYTLYTVRLQFASGAEQSVVITAPPGGLQPEMRDMNGDSVPNDLVLSSRLFRWPLIVLLNEGHDHLTVAISPGSFASGEGRASGPHQVQRALALVSFGLKRGGLNSYGSPHYLQLAEKLLSALAFQSTSYAEHPSASGRAPTALTTASAWGGSVPWRTVSWVMCATHGGNDRHTDQPKSRLQSDRSRLGSRRR